MTVKQMSQIVEERIDLAKRADLDGAMKILTQRFDGRALDRLLHRFSHTRCHRSADRLQTFIAGLHEMADLVRDKLPVEEGANDN